MAEKIVEKKAEVKVARQRLSVLEMAETLGNISEACRRGGMDRTSFGNAVKYALKQRFWLEKYLLDGRLEIDNNRAERSIKPFVIGRKNWLFCNTQEGAKVSAVLYSIIETAKENNVNPFDYLTFVFRNAPNWDLANHHGSVEQLLPWNCIAPFACYEP